MKSETRANLIFLVLFFAIALPGIIKLTKKAYKSGGRDPVMRRAVRGEFAYMDPTPPVGLTRVVPPRVGRHIQRVSDRLARMQPGLRSVILGAEEPPVMSDKLNLQVIALGANAGSYRVGLFGWNSRYAPLPELYKITGMRDGTEVAGEMKEYEQQILPIELRSELQDYGYVLPPDSVIWLIATFPGETPIDTVRVHYQLDQTTLIDTIDLTSPTTAPATQSATASTAMP